MRRLSKEEVISIHEKLIHRFGGIPGFDENTIELCLYQPFQTFDGVDLYLNDLHKVCLTSYLIIKKHPFKDGNKRVGMLLLILGLRQHGYRFNLSNEKTIELGLKLADNTWGLSELITLMEKLQDK